MDICKLSLLLPLLSAVMVTQVSAGGFWDAVGAIGTAYFMYGGKRDAEPQVPLEASVLGELVQNLAKACVKVESQSVDEDLVKDALLKKFHELDENGDVTLTGEELKKFQRFTASQFCEMLEKEQQQKP